MAAQGKWPSASSEAAPVAPGARVTIQGVRTSTVVLFKSEDGNDGERVTALSLGVPLVGHVGEANPGRIAVDTITGMRWIAKSDVTLGPVAPSPAGKSSAN